MATIIKEFNLLYKYPNSNYNAYAILLGQLSAGQLSADQTTTSIIPASYLSQTRCPAYGLIHKLKNCKQLFQSL